MEFQWNVFMTETEIYGILEQLLNLPAETEVVEFKKAANGFGDQELGQYFSALSNEANLRDKPCAWIVFGVENKTHEVTGSNYKRSRAALDAVKKMIADQTTDRITFKEIYTLEYEGKRVIMFEIAPAPHGIPVAYKGHYYGREGDSLVGLKMVDTIGSGIRKMYTYQRDRLFPLPVYNISNDRVMVTIIGKILDMDYANILARNTDLPLIDIELLNRLQLKKALTAPEIRRLRSKKLIEGKKPNLIIAKDIAQKTGQSVVYSKHKGLKDRACEELLLESLRDHEVLSRDEITELLWDALPDMLNDAQKNNKIRNILFRMKKQEKIINTTKGNISTWRIKTKN